MGVNSKISVCLSFVVYPLSAHQLSPIIFWTIGLIGIKVFFTKTRENEYDEIWFLGFRGHPLGLSP
jgi:hypothetical protein